MSDIKTLALAAVVASFAVPVFAQGAAMSCTDFTESSPETQTTATEAMVMEHMGAEGSATTTEEIVSMLLESCEQNPDQPAMTQLMELPLAMK